VRETVPDRAIDEAFEIESSIYLLMSCLPPQEGKYMCRPAARAIQKFFPQGQPHACARCPARAAERVDDQMLSYMQTRAIPDLGATETPAGLHSPSRWREARPYHARLADELNAEWVAAYVEIASKPETILPTGTHRAHPGTG